jgi:hypothetical protein
MAQGVLTALQAALAGVSGGITGAQQYREMEAKRKREAEAANMQRDLFRLQLIQASGGRLAPPTEPVRAAAPAAPAMAMPSTDTVLQRALARTQTQEFGPMATPATQAALEPGRRQALGMETPPLARTSLGELLDRQTGRLGVAGAMPTPMAESAPAPVRLTSQPPAMPTPTRRRETLGGMEFELLTAADQKAQEDAEFDRAIAGLSQEEQSIARLARRLPQAAVQSILKSRETSAERTVKDQEREGTITLLQNAYVGPDGKPLPRAQAEYAARMGKDPIDLGFVTRPMSPEDRERLNIARGNLKVAQDRLKMDKGAKQDAVADVQNFYDAERKTIAEFMPTKEVDKQGKVIYKKPAILPGSISLKLTKSDWTNWLAGEDAQRYASAVKRISDSYAVAKEGRGASNADKESYLNAVMVRPGEFGNYRLMDEKWTRLQSYINFLESKDKKGVSNRQAAGTAGGSALDDLENMGR